MLRGLRFNVASQKLDDASGDVTAGTGSDVNDNEKPEDEGPSDLPASDSQDEAKKERRARRSKKTGRKERAGGEKHHHMEEEQATDSDDDLSGKTARKLATQTSDKGKRIHSLHVL